MSIGNRAIAFLDILGFESQVNQLTLEAEDLFSTIKSTLDYISDFADSASEFDAEDVQYCIFSDACFISAPLTRATNERSEKNFHFVLAAAQSISEEMLSRGFLVRGGIAIGPAYHQGNKIFGPAINRAYHLEARIANYPRIILGKEASKFLAESKIQREKLIFRSADGPCTINPFWKYQEFARSIVQDEIQGDFREEPPFRRLSNVRNNIILGLDSNQDLPHIFQKFWWLAKDFNNKIIPFGDDIGSKWLQPISQQEIR